MKKMASQVAVLVFYLMMYKVAGFEYTLILILSLIMLKQWEVKK